MLIKFVISVNVQKPPDLELFGKGAFAKFRGPNVASGKAHAGINASQRISQICFFDVYALIFC